MRCQRLLREAGADSEPEPVSIEAEAIKVGGDRLRWQCGRARSRRRRARSARCCGGELRQRLQSLGPGVIV